MNGVCECVPPPRGRERSHALTHSRTGRACSVAVFVVKTPSPNVVTTGSKRRRVRRRCAPAHAVHSLPGIEEGRHWGTLPRGGGWGAEWPWARGHKGGSSGGASSTALTRGRRRRCVQVPCCQSKAIGNRFNRWRDRHNAQGPMRHPLIEDLLRVASPPPQNQIGSF